MKFFSKRKNNHPGNEVTSAEKVLINLFIEAINRWGKNLEVPLNWDYTSEKGEKITEVQKRNAFAWLPTILVEIKDAINNLTEAIENINIGGK